MSTATRPDLQGAAYGRGPQSSDRLLTEVGPGTPAGEYLRRYWHPIAVSERVTSRPQNVRLLGEDLILFRDKSGRPGLLYPRCMHRGTTLYYGKVDERGIRCCYHGWLFAVDGQCLEQPCEPEGGLHRETARQPWYPVQERYGLVFAYMGPTDKMPELPRYDALEDVHEGEFYAAFGGGFSVKNPVLPCNWLQLWENIMDPYHVYVLHSNFSTVQFAQGFKVMPSVDFEYVPGGVMYHAYRKFDDGRSMDRRSVALLPNISAVPAIDLAPGPSRGMQWFVPVDDTHLIFFGTSVTNQKFDINDFKIHNGKSWDELTEEEHQDYPGDYEAQVGQGAVSLHSEEHLATSDRGIGMLRRLMTQQIKAVQEGRDPDGVVFDEDRAVVKILSGNFFQS